MDLNDNIKNNIQKLRRDRNITQEVLAAALEVSVQAVSKWETGTSLPDIMQLPRIAQFFGITIDYLFYNNATEQPYMDQNLPDDNILRVVQFLGNKMLTKDTWEEDKYLELKIPNSTGNNESKDELHMEIWGNANIKGNINGNVHCNILNCGNIGGNAECSESINCSQIGGYAQCGGGMNCGNIEGYVKCGESLNSGFIGGNIECGGDLNSGDIQGNVDCKGSIHCKDIHGDAHCAGDIIYEK